MLFRSTGVSFERSLLRWCRKYTPPKGGYGSLFAGWIHSAAPEPYNSFGNGSAMRVSPCGWLSTREEVLRYARLSAECTHDHPEGIKGAVCIADCILYARSGASKDDIKRLASDQYGYNVGQSCQAIRQTNTFDATCQVTYRKPSFASWKVPTSRAPLDLQCLSVAIATLSLR